MKTQEAYSDWSANYDVDRNLTRDLDQRVTRQTLANLSCRTIVELGCGTGKNTALLCEISEEVLAFDFSAGMVARAKEKLRHDNLSFAVVDLAEPWPCRDQFADLVVCNLVLEHIRDLSRVFSEAGRALVTGGCFFISELHPYRQYQGTKAHFQRGSSTIEIEAFIHHVSEFLDAGQNCGLSLRKLKEWWHEADANKPPRLVSFMFEKKFDGKTQIS